MSACDIALRGNPGNTFRSILRNLAFERRPLHARHVFLFVIHPMLVLFDRNRPVIFFSASTTVVCLPHISFPNAPLYNNGGLLLF
jgi:hypothetical protein